MVWLVWAPVVARLRWCCGAQVRFTSIYFGELPVSFAASIGHCDFITHLINHGANCDLQVLLGGLGMRRSPYSDCFQDAYGNTAMHMAVLHNQVESAGVARTLTLTCRLQAEAYLRLHQHGADPNLANVEGVCSH